ncbi:MAG: hypothetical protein QG556_842 [Pseudomonadota bacterium]|nr:hypothetical protein [Pseudomonadota bacterium]
MEIKTVPIESIFIDPANARKHPKKNMDAIKGSISKFEQVEPLVVQKGKKIIIGGNGRYQAMKELGFKEVQIVEVDLNDTQAAALAISLNRTSELAEWDLDVLPELLASLQELDFDLSSIGFDDSYLNNFKEIDAPEINDREDVPENMTITFTVTRTQNEIIQDAINNTTADIKKYGESSNRNANSITWICEKFLQNL